MSLPSQSVKEFISDSYQLITAGSPTVPLYGNDTIYAVRRLNKLISYYSGTALLTTIAQEAIIPLAIGQQNVTFGSPLYAPLPDSTTFGRLSNLQNAWLLLDGVTYPLIDQSRNEFLASFKYDPQLGLPRYCIIYDQTNLTTMRLFPGPSQFFELHVYGKFEPPPLTENSDMSQFPEYFLRFLNFALGRDLAAFKGRLSAWTPELRELYLEAKQEMDANSSINLAIEADLDSSLNGSWRVKAGI
jgi:hypothetical protein